MQNRNSHDKPSCILAVDPGISGAVACVERNSKGKPIRIFLQSIITRGHPSGPMVDCDAMVEELSGIPSPHLVLFEEPFAVYAQRGRVTTSAHTLKISLVNFGRMQGVIERVTGVRNWLTIAPSVWKNAMGLSKDKKKSLLLAREIFPMASDLLSKAKDHDRAEALLLTEYAYWYLWNSPVCTLGIDR